MKFINERYLCNKSPITNGVSQVFFVKATFINIPFLDFLVETCKDLMRLSAYFLNLTCQTLINKPCQ